MLFVVYAVEKPDASDRRLATIDAHRAYLAAAPARHGVSILISGPLMDDDRQAMREPFFLLDAPDRAAIEAMFA